MKVVRFIVLLFIIIGALNWGFLGFFQIDLVKMILGSNTSCCLARLVYSIIGLAGLYGISFFFNPCVYGCTCSVCQGKEKKEK